MNDRSEAEAIANEIKGLFHHLVQAVGGCEAAATRLGISQQRVSQLQLLSCPDVPTLVHITVLERWLGRPTVTEALAERVTNNLGRPDPLKEAGDVIEAGAEVFRLVRAGADKRDIEKAVSRLEQETDEVAAAVRA